MAVMNFIGRSSVAAVEMGIEELLEGHPLQEVWTRLLETRDITCVADLYGLSVTDLTAIRGFGPVAVGDIISAVNDKQPWKFRLAPGCLDIDADGAADAAADLEDEKPAAAPCGATDLAGIIGDDRIVSALAEAGITGIDDLVIFTIGELAAIEGVGEEGANLIMERTDDLDLEMPLADGQGLPRRRARRKARRGRRPRGGDRGKGKRARVVGRRAFGRRGPRLHRREAFRTGPAGSRRTRRGPFRRPF